MENRGNGIDEILDRVAPVIAPLDNDGTDKFKCEIRVPLRPYEHIIYEVETDSLDKVIRCSERLYEFANSKAKAVENKVNIKPEAKIAEQLPIAQVMAQQATANVDMYLNSKCENCGKDTWDNRKDKKYENGPDFKCKDKECAWAAWLPFKQGDPLFWKGPKLPTKANYQEG